MQPVIFRNYVHCTVPTVKKEDAIIDNKPIWSSLMDLNLYKRSKGKSKHASNQSLRSSSETSNDLNNINEIINQLNNMPSIMLAKITSFESYNAIRNLIRDLFIRWHSSQELTQNETYLLQESIRFLNNLFNTVEDLTKFTSWLFKRSWIKAVANCMKDIDQLLIYDQEQQNLNQLSSLFDILITCYQQYPTKFRHEINFDRLFEASIDCLISLHYDRVFRKLKPKARSMTIEQTFFLIKCPSFFTIYHGKKTIHWHKVNFFPFF